MRCAAKLLVALACLPVLAAAAPVTLTQVGQPATYKPGGRTVDVLGITPGMQPNEVRDILAKSYGNVVVTQDDLGLENRGVVVQTQNFVTRMTAQRDTDEVVVWFATPTTGNGVVEVTRQLSYRDETAAPPMQQAQAELIARYGPPGFNGPAVGTGEVRLLAWSFHGNTPTPCPRSSCRNALSEGLDVRNLAAYGRSIKTGNELTVVVTLLSGIADSSRASGMVITMSDAATKFRTLDAAVSQMKAASTHKGTAKAGE
ncbi:MAG: hypothetical protein ACRYF2_19855 [Janthinobacterium lividum]